MNLTLGDQVFPTKLLKQVASVSIIGGESQNASSTILQFLLSFRERFAAITPDNATILHFICL